MTCGEEDVVLSSVVGERPGSVITSSIVVTDPWNVRRVVVGVDRTFGSGSAGRGIVLAEDGIGRGSDRSSIDRGTVNFASETSLIEVGGSSVCEPVP